ncbi:MAG: hypothetical protein LC627_02140, partial [Verrucomicrobiaceae bacterium]|nr:hypothetical protein [Verrucomicrobiaceae bacterium]
MIQKSKVSKLNIGIIGAGWPGHQHAKAIRATDVANLYACAELDEARLSAFEEEQQPEKSCRDYHELLADDSVWYLMGTPRPTAVSAQVFQNFANLAQVP